MSQYTSYYLYQKYVKYGDQDWIPVYPTEYSISGDSSDPQTITKKQDNDPECGYTPPVVLQYRWVQDGDNYICDECGYVPPTPQYRTISGTPYCTGYDKMVDTQYQVSYDNGSTWSKISGSTQLIEHNSQDCGYVPQYSTQYLTFRALEDGSEFGLITNENTPFYYSSDSGSTWYELTAWSGGSKPYFVDISSGATIMFKGTLTAPDVAMVGIGRFRTYEGRFEVEGNIMSLLYGDNFSGQTALNASWEFYGLFSGCTGLTSAENLILPATTLTNDCYAFMFDQCTSLTTAPELPARTLAGDCYYQMFGRCTSLATAPELPATTLAGGCYKNMFAACTSLTTAPELPATTLEHSCYLNMFDSCTSLSATPVLSATTLALSCYWGMFRDCENLSEITCLATDISATDSRYKWVENVPGGGTFYKNPSMNDWPAGDNGIPWDWTVQDYQG